jgi:mono/diheme cytochrome c family protein
MTHWQCLKLLPALMLILSSAASADDAVLQAKEDFVSLCAPCHGPDGTGNGPKAEQLGRKPADLSHITARHGGRYPEQLIFGTIAGLDMPDGHGTREMPIWGDVFVTEGVGASTKVEDAMKASDDASRRIMALVRYVEQLQAQP